MKSSASIGALVFGAFLFVRLPDVAGSRPSYAAVFERLFVRATRGPQRHPSPYRQHTLPPTNLNNSSRLRDLIHDGKLELSLSDALALALENNLDISVQRYVVPMAQVDVLRTKSGSAARGFAGATIPLGLQRRRTGRRGKARRWPAVAWEAPEASRAAAAR